MCIKKRGAREGQFAAGNCFIWSEKMKESPLFEVANRYPQLRLPIKCGEKDTEEYKDAVLRGKPVFRELEFNFSPDDSLTLVDTPVGKAEVLFLANREDFVHALRALAYRCEPVEIPASVGASTVRGLINWEKISGHKRTYLAQGGNDWAAEFKRFTANKNNYQDSIILLSAGEYSALPAEAVGLAPKEWLDRSRIIREYHELTHFICRQRYPNNIDAVRDEVIADMVGMIAAFGAYDPELARRFLGTEGGSYRAGGRLSHYTEESKLPEAVAFANQLIDQCARQVKTMEKEDVFALLLRVCENIFSFFKTVLNKGCEDNER